MTLRETVAAAIYTSTLMSPEEPLRNEDEGWSDDWTNYYSKRKYRDQADAAIAALTEALLSPEAVEAGADAVCGPERSEEWGYKIVRQAHMDAYRKQLTAALAAITAPEHGE